MSSCMSRRLAQEAFKKTPKQIAKIEYVIAMGNSGKTGRSAFRSIGGPGKYSSRNIMQKKLSRGDALGNQSLDIKNPQSKGDYASSILKLRSLNTFPCGNKDSKGRLKESISKNKQVRTSARRRLNVKKRGVGDLAKGSPEDRRLRSNILSMKRDKIRDREPKRNAYNKIYRKQYRTRPEVIKKIKELAALPENREKRRLEAIAYRKRLKEKL